MAMFARKPKFFGAAEVYNTPGIGGGLPGGTDWIDPGAPDTTALPAQPTGGKIDWGTTLAGGLADGVARYFGAEPGYGPAMQAQEKAQQEWAQRIALEQYKRANPEPTALQRNAEYLGSRNPEYRETYERSQANPMITTIDPSTGGLIMMPKGGFSAPSTAASPPVVADRTSYDAVPAGAQYRDPQGNIRTKQ